MAKRMYLRERRPGYFQLGYYLGINPVTGKADEITEVFTGDRPGAEAALIDLAARVQRRSWRSAQRDMTVNGLVEMYLNLVEVEPSTLVGYWAKYRTHIRPSVVGRTKATRLTASQVALFYRALVKEKGIKVATVRRVHAVLSGAFKYAMVWSELGLTSNPLQGVPLPKDNSMSPERAPDPDQVQALLALVDKDALTAFTVAAFCGTRRGETLALRLMDLEFEGDDDPYLHVRHSLYRLTKRSIAEGIEPGSGHVMVADRTWLKDTKGHADRRVPLDEVTRDVLALHLKWMEVRASLEGVEMVDNPFLFSDDPTGAVPWFPDRISTKWSRLASGAGQKVRLHDLRHFYGTQLGQSGAVSLVGVARLMGHKQTVTTERYLKLTNLEAKTAARTIGVLAARMQASRADRSV